MDRKRTTQFLGELLVSDKFGGIGKYWASEVSIDPWASKGKPKRVDFMQFIPAGQCSISEIEKGILCGNSITKNGILNVTYDLCCKCMEDFERFMKKENV